MDAETAKKLRDPFPAEVVGKLPKVWCGKCREANKNRRPACDDHRRVKCPTCKQTMTDAHLHVDYVGHAAITDRLLQVDTEWSWEPVAFGPDGLPVLDKAGGLWIRLTVAGMTRLGYGDAEGKTGPSAVKEAIGDALRNSAMRFGVGLDLWHKDGQLVQPVDELADQPAPATPPTATPPPDEPRPTGQNGAAPARSKDATEALEELAATCGAMGYDREKVADLFAAEHNGANVRAASTPSDAALLRTFIQHLDDVDPARLKAPVTNGAPQ